LGGTTRRQFLVRGGAVAGVLAFGGTAALVPSRGRAEATALTAARRQTYTALMADVVTQPSIRLDAAVAPAAAAQFAAVYAGWPAERRRDADEVLDALEASSGLARPTTARPGPAEREHLELTVRALELAAVVLGPPDSGHEIVTVA
jgi:hypothetical protein